MLANNFPVLKRGRLITIGSFDGVHLGHQALLTRTVHEAQKRQRKSLALTFAVPPRMVLDRNAAHRILSTPEEKAVLIRSFGIDEVKFLDFDKKVATIKPFTFFRGFLLNDLKAKGIVVGADFRFGMGRAAGALELVRWGEEFEIPVWVISPVKTRGQVISSTLIRHLLETNRYKQAIGFLGHPYLIQGRVVTGHRIGRKLGFPTANIKTFPGKIIPRGVFAVRGTILKSKQPQFEGVCNIGTRPTFRDGTGVSTEVHIFGKSPRLTGKTLQVELVQWLRAERKFENPRQLQRAIASDIYRAKTILS